VSSPVWAPSLLRPRHRIEPLEHAECRQADGENDGPRAEYHMHIQHHGGHSNREWRSLSPEGPGPKAFGGNVRDTCFPKHYRAPNNIVKYDGKTNPGI
jgi:hypothetical protein